MTAASFAINFTIAGIGLFLMVGAIYVLRLLPRLSFTLSSFSALLIGISGALLVGLALSFKWEEGEYSLVAFLLVLSLGVSLGMENWVRGSRQGEGSTESRMTAKRT